MSNVYCPIVFLRVPASLVVKLNLKDILRVTKVWLKNFSVNFAEN